MTQEDSPAPNTVEQSASQPSGEEKLDLAAVAEQLAAEGHQRQEGPGIEEAEAAEGEVEAESEGQDEIAVAESEEDALAAKAGEDEDGPDLAIGEHELTGAEIYAAVEALLFAADRPVTPAQMARALPRGVNAREVRKQLKAMRDELDEAERGFELREIAGGWQLLTCEKYSEYVAKLKKTAGPRKLSGSALEALAVVAYKQPVTRAEVERIRGVACGDMLRNLMEKRLVKISGRSPELGNPLLYGTTQDFLNHFGLGTIGDLPRSSELGRKPKSTMPAVPKVEADSDVQAVEPKDDGGVGEGIPSEEVAAGESNSRNSEVDAATSAGEGEAEEVSQ